MTNDYTPLLVSILMRLYDVNMALLASTNPELADKVFDAHDRGESFNPKIYVLELDDVE